MAVAYEVLSDDTAPVAYGDRAGSVLVRGQGWRTVDVAEEVYWHLPEEAPVALAYNGRSYAVMMATPADLGDFAIGFSLSEGIVDDAAEIAGVTIADTAAGLCVVMAVPPARAEALAERRRAMAGPTGCGLCGIETLEAALRDPEPVVAGVTPTPGAIARAFAELPEHQPMNRISRSLHAAAWCGPDGSILTAREDVGRHNALDKLIGALAAENRPIVAGFVVMTSRCSVELVQKAATVGIPLLATVSAPTLLALTLARRAGMTLAARSSSQGVVLFR